MQLKDNRGFLKLQNVSSFRLAIDKKKHLTAAEAQQLNFNWLKVLGYYLAIQAMNINKHGRKCCFEFVRTCRGAGTKIFPGGCVVPNVAIISTFYCFCCWSMIYFMALSLALSLSLPFSHTLPLFPSLAPLLPKMILDVQK